MDAIQHKQNESTEDEYDRKMADAVAEIATLGWSADVQSKNTLVSRVKKDKNWLDWTTGDWSQADLKKCQKLALTKIIGVIILVLSEDENICNFDLREAETDMQKLADYCILDESISSSWIVKIHRTMATVFQAQVYTKSNNLPLKTANKTIIKFLKDLTKETPHFYKAAREDIFEHDSCDIMLNALKNLAEVSQQQGFFCDSRKFLGTDLSHLFVACWMNNIINDEEFVNLKRLFAGSYKSVVQALFNNKALQGCKSLELISTSFVCAMSELMVFLSDADKAKRIRLESAKDEKLKKAKKDDENKNSNSNNKSK